MFVDPELLHSSFILENIVNGEKVISLCKKVDEVAPADNSNMVHCYSLHATLGYKGNSYMEAINRIIDTNKAALTLN